jgi:cbb3-type cytochrome oxidase subunit 3
MDEYLEFLTRDFSLFGITIEYWTIIALALFLACIVAWLFAKKL